jgi:predicted RNA-binding protein YlqC (UPF0109 family)
MSELEKDTVDLQTLSLIINNLVTEPSEVVINREIDEKGVLLKVKVSAKDMGIVIGRNGIMANSIKTIMRALGKAHDMNIRLEILEPDGSLKVNQNNTDVNEGLEEFVIN